MLDSNFGHGQGMPDIIIANFDLPGMDGLSFLKALGDSGLITEKTALYVFSHFRISSERKDGEGLEQVKGFFVKPPQGRTFKKSSRTLRANRLDIVQKTRILLRLWYFSETHAHLWRGYKYAFLALFGKLSMTK